MLLSWRSTSVQLKSMKKLRQTRWSRLYSSTVPRNISFARHCVICVLIHWMPSMPLSSTKKCFRPLLTVGKTTKNKGIMSLFHKLDFLIPISLQPDVVDLWFLLTIKSVRSNRLSLKYKLFTPTGCKNIGIRKSSLWQIINLFHIRSVPRDLNSNYVYNLDLIWVNAEIISGSGS